MNQVADPRLGRSELGLSDLSRADKVLKHDTQCTPANFDLSTASSTSRTHLNPIERFWLRLKADWFCDFIARTP